MTDTGTNNLVGGFVGAHDNGTFKNSFWDTQTSNQANAVGSGSSIGVTGKTTAEMMQTATFSDAGWNIANTGGSNAIWRIYEGQTYPLLRSFLIPLTITANSATTTYNGLAQSLPGTFSYKNTLTNATITPNANLFGTSTVTGSGTNAGTYNFTPTNNHSNQQGYDISYAAGTLTINKAPLLISATDIIKMYGLSYIFEGTEFSSLGLVNGETIGTVDLSSAGTAAGAKVSGSPYSILISNAEGGTFNPKNYDITYKTGKLTVKPNPLASLIINIDVEHIDNIIRRGNSNNYAILGVVGNVVKLGDNIFVRLGRSNNFRLVGSVSGDDSDSSISMNISERQLSSLLTVYRMISFYVSQSLNPFITPLQTSTTETSLADETLPSPADGILIRFEDVDVDFGQLGMCYAKTLEHGHHKHGKQKWFKKKHHHRAELKQYYNNFFFIIDGAGVKLPEGSLVFIPKPSSDSIDSSSSNTTSGTSSSSTTGTDDSSSSTVNSTSL